MSRQAMPKQFLPLLGEDTLFQRTAKRAAALADVTGPIVVCSDDHRFLVAEQLRESCIAPLAVVVEPLPRNTAPAIALAALIACERLGEDAVLVVLPSDHLIDGSDQFEQAVGNAGTLASAGHLVTFGVKPSRPETGYGYIRAGAALKQSGFRVDRFVEKPDLAAATGMIAEGGHFWNSGMFVFRARTYLDELAMHEPEMLAAGSKALAAAHRDDDFVRVDRAAFELSPSNSVDYAVMERTQHAAVVPLAADWTDIGSWMAIWERSTRDENGNVTSGDVVTVDSNNCLVHAADRRLVTTVGVDNVIVVDTPDATLVASRDRVQDVKRLVDHLKAQGRSEHQWHRRVDRPWGSYDSVDMGARFQVKRIVVKPGASLSLQMHHHRSEHWVVVSGTAEVTCDERTFLLGEGESTFIPLGSKHRLKNPGRLPLEIVEVQVGNYLGEDDIVRFADVYGRA
jgi:mannose-1-phosphate guanylyltransferase/mannose-6-phosphate isomerase